MPEFGQTLGKFPLDKKANPAQSSVRFREMRVDRDCLLGVASCRRPSLFLFLIA